MRPLLSETKVTEHAQKKIENFHPEIISEIEKALSVHEWVIVGMDMNPVVKQARKYLREKISLIIT
jgi:acyl carrier protein phosphodiesterase